MPQRFESLPLQRSRPLALAFHAAAPRLLAQGAGLGGAARPAARSASAATHERLLAFASSSKQVSAQVLRHGLRSGCLRANSRPCAECLWVGGRRRPLPVLHARSPGASWRLTLRSTGQSKGYALRLPVTSNVRALANERIEFNGRCPVVDATVGLGRPSFGGQRTFAPAPKGKGPACGAFVCTSPTRVCLPRPYGAARCAAFVRTSPALVCPPRPYGVAVRRRTVVRPFKGKLSLCNA